MKSLLVGKWKLVNVRDGYSYGSGISLEKYWESQDIYFILNSNGSLLNANGEKGTWTLDEANNKLVTNLVSKDNRKNSRSSYIIVELNNNYLETVDENKTTMEWKNQNNPD